MGSANAASLTVSLHSVMHRDIRDSAWLSDFKTYDCLLFPEVAPAGMWHRVTPSPCFRALQLGHGFSAITAITHTCLLADRSVNDVSLDDETFLSTSSQARATATVSLWPLLLCCRLGWDILWSFIHDVFSFHRAVFRLDPQDILVVFAEKTSLATMLSSVCSLALTLMGIFGTICKTVCRPVALGCALGPRGPS